MKARDGYTKRVVRFVVDTRLENIPTDAVRTAKNAILDCLGVALAGSQEKCARICAEHGPDSSVPLVRPVYGEAAREIRRGEIKR